MWQRTEYFSKIHRIETLRTIILLNTASQTQIFIIFLCILLMFSMQNLSNVRLKTIKVFLLTDVGDIKFYFASLERTRLCPSPLYKAIKNAVKHCLIYTQLGLCVRFTPYLWDGSWKLIRVWTLGETLIFMAFGGQML